MPQLPRISVPLTVSSLLFLLHRVLSGAPPPSAGGTSGLML